MENLDEQTRFEQTIMPHLDAAYNLARWLTRNEHDAEDVAQESLLRAFKFFGAFRGENARSWLLSIVRNTTYTWLQKNRKQELSRLPDEELHEIEDPAADPQALLLENSDHGEVMRKSSFFGKWRGCRIRKLPRFRILPRAQSCRGWRALGNSCSNL